MVAVDEPSTADPLTSEAVTTTPAVGTAFPWASWSRTTGCRVSATALVAVKAGCVVSASCDAGPGFSSVVVPETFPSPGAENWSRKRFTVPLSVSEVNVALPAASVVAVFPVSVTVPDTTPAVTTTPACATALPDWSWTCTAGCVASATPLWALVEAPVTMPSFVAAPGVSVTPPETTDVNPVAANRRV